MAVTLSDETLNPCCQWPTPKCTSPSLALQPESPETRSLIHSSNSKFWKRRLASSRPRAEINQTQAPWGPRRARSALRRPSLGRRPPRSWAGAARGSGARRADQEKTRRHALRRRAAPRLLSVGLGGRRGPSHSPPRRRTAPALASSPRRPGVRVSSRRPAGPGPLPASPPLLLAAPARVHAVARAGAAAGNRSPSHTYPAPSPPFPPLWSSGPPPLLQMR